MEYDYLEAFRKERVSQGITQQKIGDYIGMSVGCISLRENGVRSFSADELHRIYKKFGIKAGFDRVYRVIDNNELESLLKKNRTYKITVLSLNELQAISDKDYKALTIYTLEKIKRILEYDLQYVIPDKELEFIVLKSSEKKQLKKLLEEFYRKDHNIKRALDLLKVAIRP